MSEHSENMEEFDLVIVGGGCAGLAAALYAKRYGMKVKVIAKELGGLITTTHIVENYPGILPMSGWDMMEIFFKQMKGLDVDMETREVTKIEKHDEHFHTCTDKGCIRSKTLIWATGTHHRKLDAPGEQDYANKGVSYCATCDGALFKGQKLAIIGGGDSAAKEALLLSEYGTHVYVIARSTLKAEPINAERITHNEKITVLEGTEVTEIAGDGNNLTHVKLTKEFEGSDTLEIGGLFIAIGQIAQNDLVKDLGLDMNERGEVKIDRYSRTNVPMFYAAGDNTDAHWKQAIISAAEGSQAANSAFEDLTSKKVRTM